MAELEALERKREHAVPASVREAARLIESSLASMDKALQEHSRSSSRSSEAQLGMEEMSKLLEGLQSRHEALSLCCMS